MPAVIDREQGDLRVLRVTGLLTKSELDAALNGEARHWSPRTRIRLYVVADGFKGWKRDDDWGDMTFSAKHRHQVLRIAAIGDPAWETEILMFLGAGLRRAAVRFFPTGQDTAARAWLAESETATGGDC